MMPLIFTGCGKLPSFTFRYNVGALNGTNRSLINCVGRMYCSKPGSLFISTPK